MRKRILRFLLALVMIIAMIPLAGITTEAALVDPQYMPKASYSYSSSSDPSSVSITDFTPNAGGWVSGTSPKTKDFVAYFNVQRVAVLVPAYTKMSIDFTPSAGVNTLTTECSSYFGVELFRFDNEGDWNNITFNTDENTNRSNGYSLGRDIAHTVAGIGGETSAEVATTFEKEFDNPTGTPKTVNFYYGVLAFYRSTSVFEHQLDTWWHFISVYNSPTYKYLEYDANGGSGSAAMVETTDTVHVTLHSGEGFSKPNSVFLGWSDGQTVYAPGSVYTKAEGACLKAQYLTYDTSGCSGTVTPGTRGENGVVIADGSSLYKVGHTFKHWTESQHGYGTPYVLGDVYSGNNEITLYPIFEPNKYDLDLVTENCTASVNQNPATYGTRVYITAMGSIGYEVRGYEVYKTDDPTVRVSLYDADSFFQPEYPVTVKPVLSKIPYAVEKLPSENGSFTVSHETAVIDDIVTVTAIPEAGFELDTITVTRANSGEPLAVTGNSFTMVPEPVKVAVAFKSSVYDITKAPATNGSFTLTPEHAIMGETVVVNAVPNEGYQVKNITAYKTGDETATIEVTGGSFVMPSFPVTVAVEFEPALLDIFKSSTIENGDLTISHTQAQLGETVTVSATAAEGYTLDAITVYKTGDETVTVEITDGSFVMPTYPVTVHATFKKIDYTVSVEDASNEKGSFTVDKTTAQMGDTVTVDVACAEGWAVRGITLTRDNGESRLVEKTFTMPADNVTVSVSYMVIPTYVITIPAKAELGGAPMTVAISNAVMEEGVNLKVILETDFTARTAEGAEKAFSVNGGAVQNGDAILVVDGGGTPEAPKSGSVKLTLDWDNAYQYSGSYRATLAFTIKVEDEGYDQNE